MKKLKIHQKIALGLSVGVATVMSVSSAVRADNFSQYFASSVSLNQDWFNNWKIRFVPTKNSYVYQIQVAGKKATGGLDCTRYSATVQERISWGKVKAQIGASNSQIGGSFAGDGQVVEVYGGSYNRYGTGVSSAVHMRVAVLNQSGRELYKTTWYGGPDISNWDWPSNCSWVRN